MGARDKVLSYTIADSHLMPLGINSSYDDSIPTAYNGSTTSPRVEYGRGRLIGISLGAVHVGRVAGAVYIVCSADVLHQTSVYFH